MKKTSAIILTEKKTMKRFIGNWSIEWLQYTNNFIHQTKSIMNNFVIAKRKNYIVFRTKKWQRSVNVQRKILKNCAHFFFLKKFNNSFYLKKMEK